MGIKVGIHLLPVAVGEGGIGLESIAHAQAEAKLQAKKTSLILIAIAVLGTLATLIAAGAGIFFLDFWNTTVSLNSKTDELLSAIESQDLAQLYSES